MIDNPFYLISLFISAFLAFFTAVLFVEIVLTVFRIKHPRLRAILRWIPFCSLGVDFLFNRLSIGNWLNPLSCKSCIQNELLEMFFPDLQRYLKANHISLMKYLAVEDSYGIFSILFMVFYGISAVLILRKLLQAGMISHSLRKLQQNSTSCDRVIENPRLIEDLTKNQVCVLVNSEIQIPLATYAKVIILPKTIITEFSQTEFETVLAHELEHLRWKDPLTRGLLQLIAALFWWVPTRSWVNKIEQDQEMACDQSIVKYGLDCHSLASALVKVTAQAKNQGETLLCYLTGKRSPLVARLHTLLGLPSGRKNHLLKWGIIEVALGAAIILLCKS